MSPSKLRPELVELANRGPLPDHIAVIMDGNGRWAKQRGKNRIHGHKQGVHSVRDVTETCAQLGIKFLTLYTFSTENWNRPALEVDALMHLLIRALRKEAETFRKNNIRLQTIGDVSELPESCQIELAELKKETAENSRMTLTLALSYSGRWELMEAFKSMGASLLDGKISLEDIDEKALVGHMSSSFLPDPDLLIRTGGETRISNFLLWQIAYSELYFSPIFWPDFRQPHLIDAIKDFQDRDRRYGRVQDPI
ncbi:MAG: isoprenyl transferase [Bacteroidetes bacterium]|nr:isoprenyl transferase [Bacteroidota bacterium]